MPSTRISLPGPAVVPMSNRWRASRLLGAAPSSVRRSTPARHEDTKTAGSANTVSSTNAGWIDMSNATVMRMRPTEPIELKNAS